MTGRRRRFVARRRRRILVRLFVVFGRRLVLLRRRRRWRWFAVVAAGRVIEVARLGAFAAWNMTVIRDDGWFRFVAFTSGISSNDRRHRDNRRKESRQLHNDD
jgi:hypothetical protein